MEELKQVLVSDADPPHRGAAFFDAEFESDTEIGQRAITEAIESLTKIGAFQVPRREFELWLCLQELVTNAIRHGNAFDRQKRCRLTLFVWDQRCVARVEDQGDGFDPRTLADPLHNIYGESGRGVFLVRTMVERLEYYRGGRCVEAEVSLAPSTESKSSTSK